ncbi:MAG: hypothetical protein A3J93_01245 [Candidatus Magasanikbacteria bacterium RIFOXYC2_FULL_42_28]|uniref:LTD domain-containing protein n=1 Tax=Candidatus Magasanikbacteria bacterium RIFOXYC2_FULL_42_28 TaxID=1798704 RepID=A0A1F6NYH3_9BACT|nr:MAG: hypothetical protein A3J93_01245 [Candidatus Magasanikbacteria bacterium RIFOXYC2_FULL_42_28]
MLSRRGKVALYATIVAIFLFLFGIFGADRWFGAEQALGYDQNIAHPNIVELAAQVYNAKFNPDLTAEQIGWMKQGAIEEDTPTRWLNHFYDPVNDRGLLFNNFRYQSSKKWAQDPFNQQNFSMGDNSWQKAFLYYYKANAKDAFITLGHTLHLIADASVPAHTRDDPHPTGDSYEQFVKNNWEKLVPEIKKLSQFQKVDSLDGAFDSVAKFSNGNFYSDDTIDIDSYKYPSVADLFDQYQTIGKGYYKFKVNKNLSNSLVCRDPRINTWQDVLKNKFDDFVCLVDDDTVLTSYSQNLLPKAVGYTAGVIRLFIEQAESEEVHDKVPLIYINPKGMWDTVVAGLVNKAKDIWDKIKGTGGESVGAEALGELSSPGIVSLPPPPRPLLGQEGESQPLPPAPSPVSKPQVAPQPTSLPTQPSAPNPVVEPIVAPATVPVSPVVPITPIVNNPPPTIYYGGGGGGGSSPPSAVIPTEATGGSEVEESLNDNFTTTPETTSSTPDTSTTTTVIPSEVEGSLNDTTSTPDISTTTPDTTTSTPETSTSTPDTPTTTPDTTTTTPSVSTTTDSGTTITSTPESPPPPVPVADIIINEIAWAGTDSGHANNEWLELYNTTDEPVTFAWTGTDRWLLRSNGVNFSIISSKTKNLTIPARGYYLLERTNDDTVKAVAADAVFSLFGGLNNAGALVELVAPSGEVVDSVDASAGWFAGGGDEYRSLERLSEYASSSDPNNWQNNQGPRYLPRTANGGKIYGSPKSDNSRGLALFGNQDEDEVILTASNSPYLLSGYTVKAGKKLIIDSGAVIKSNDFVSNFKIYGEFIVNATNTPAVLTSGRDQSFESDILNELIGDYDAGLPLAKDWQGIMFYPGSISNINGLDMRYAGYEFKEPGSGMWDPKVSKAIWVQDIDLTISSSTFSLNGDTTIYGDNANLDISNSDFSSGVLAIDADDGSLAVSGGKISEFSSANGPIEANDIWLVITGVTFENNATDAVYVNAPHITTAITWSTGAQFNLNSLTIDDGAVLTIEAGVEVRLAKYADITVYGELIVNGTAEAPVKFLPISSGQNWGNLKFMSASGTLNNVLLTEGNLSTTEDQAGNGTIIVSDSNVTLNNVQVLDSRSPSNAIQINSGEVRIADSILGHNSKPSFETAGIKMLSGELWLDNVLFQNLDYGLRATGINPWYPYHLENTSAENYVNVNKQVSPMEWAPVEG